MNTITIYCMLPYVWTYKSKEKYNEIMNTWGQQCDAIKFLIDPIVQIQKPLSSNNGTLIYEDATLWSSSTTTNDKNIDPSLHTLPDNVKIIHTMTRPWHTCIEKNGKKADECRNIWEKIWRSIVWVNENEKQQYDWYIKCDWDTYVFINNIRYYITQQQQWIGKQQHIYAGHEDLHKPGKPFISGALQIFSHRTFHSLANVFRTMPKATKENITSYTGEDECRDGAGLADFPTAHCVRTQLHIEPQNTREKSTKQQQRHIISTTTSSNTNTTETVIVERERVLLFPPQDLLTFNRTKQGEWWYWGGKPPTVGDMEDCCAHLPFAFHARIYKDAKAGHYYMIEYELFNKTFPDVFDPIHYPKMKRPEIVVPYYDKVRQALKEHDLIPS